MFHLDAPDNTKIQVNVHRFFDMMLLRDHFDVPLWGRVQFLTDGMSFVPRSFIAALGNLLGEEGKHLDPSKPWHICEESDLTKAGLKPEDITSSMYRGRYQASPEASAPAAPGVPPRELEVHRHVYVGYIDLLTQVIPDAGHAYYVRRILSRKGHQIWVANAYQLAGPWKVWQREPSELLALGLNI
jgi:hypothetical protein